MTFCQDFIDDWLRIPGTGEALKVAEANILWMLVLYFQGCTDLGRMTISISPDINPSYREAGLIGYFSASINGTFSTQLSTCIA